MEKLENIHPGEVLLHEFMIPLDLSAYKLSKSLNISQTRISEIIRGKRKVSADTAIRLSRLFGNSPNFWLSLQDDYDIEEEQNKKNEDYNKIQTIELIES
ncbi:MAG: HigA family addiction module antitoxin [Candidatus Kapaibacteriales bacterium]